MMNYKGFGKKWQWPNTKYYLSIYPKRLRKTTKNLSRGSRRPGRDLNTGPLEYEVGELTTRPLRSVSLVECMEDTRNV
jgi:hypothetical protein